MKNVHTTIDWGDELALNTSLFLLRAMSCRRCLIKATLQLDAIVMQDAWLDTVMASAKILYSPVAVRQVH